MADAPNDIPVGSVWRDRDKRMSSGNRHVRIFAGAVKDGEPAALCVRVYRLPGGAWHVSQTAKVCIKERVLRKRFVQVEE